MLVDYYLACTDSYVHIEIQVHVEIVDCRRFVRQKGTVRVLIGLAARVIAVKTVVADSPIMEVVEVDGDDI